jgi:uncharacterized protein (UPF0216 family)
MNYYIHTSPVRFSAKGSWNAKLTCSISIRQHTSAYVSIRQHTSQTSPVRFSAKGSSNAKLRCLISIRQHTSAYVSICHLYDSRPKGARTPSLDARSAYVSIRQQTSAYVTCTILGQRELERQAYMLDRCGSRAPALRLPLIIHLNTSACVSMRQRTSAFVSIRCSRAPALRLPLIIHLNTSAYVRMRQHTSAYVSIRQHTSAYVSIRRHTWLSCASAKVAIDNAPAPLRAGRRRDSDAQPAFTHGAVV